MPIVVADLTAQLSVDSSKLTSGLAQAKAAFNEMGGSTRSAGEALRQIAQFDKEVEAETAKLTALLNGQSKAAADVAARYTELKPAEQAHLVALKEQVAAQSAMTAAAAKTTVSLQAFGTAAATAGHALTQYLSLPLIALGALAVKSSLDIAHAMDTIRQQTGATGAPLAALGDSFKRVSAQVPQRFGEVAKAIALVSQRTHETGAPLEALTRQELNLSRVTGTDLANNITQTTRLFQNYGITVAEQAPALDLLFRAHQQTGDAIDRLEAQMDRFAPTLKALGLGFADSAALLGTLDTHTGNVQRVLQGLNQVMTRWAKEGITDAHTAMGNLITAIRQAPSAMEALRIASAAGFGGRGGQDFVNIVRTSGLEFDKLTQKIVSGTDTINKAAQDTLHLNDAFTQLSKAIEIALQPLGDVIAQKLVGLVAAVQSATPALASLTTAFSRQGSAAQGLELAVAGIAIGTGPVLYAIGRTAQAFAALRTTVLAGAAAARTALLAYILPAAAVASVVLFTTAYFTNFDGLWTRLQTGWQALWENATAGARAFFDGLQVLGQESLREVGADFRSGVQQIVSYLHAGVAQVRGEQQQNLASLSAAAAGSPEALANTVFPVQPGAASAGMSLAAGLRQVTGAARMGRLSGRGGFTGSEGAPPNVQAMTKAQTEQLRLATEIADKEQELSVLRAGDSNILGQIVARYGALNPAEEAHLAHLMEAIKAQEKATAGQEAYRKKLADVQAQLAAVQAGDKAKTAVSPEKFAGASPEQISLLEKQEKALAAATAAQAKQVALGKEIAAFTREQTAKAQALAGATTHEQTATEALARAQELMRKAFQSGTDAEFAQARAALGLAAGNLQAENAIRKQAMALRVAQAAQEQEAQAVDHVLTGLAALAAKHQEVAGVTVEDVNAQKLYSESLTALPGILQNFALAQIVVAQNDADQIARTKALAPLMQELNAVTTQAKEKIAQYAGETKLAAVAQQLLTAALKTGDPAAIALAKSLQDLAKQADAAGALKQLDQQGEKAFTKMRSFAESQFEGLFKQLMNPSKNFFANLVQGWSKALEDMAAKAIATDLTDALFGSQPGQGASQATGQGGAGGLLGTLLGWAGGLFSGGGGPLGSAAAVATNLTGPMGLAAGGDVFGNGPLLVGERGPELFVPKSAGTVFPSGSAQTQGAMRGGGTTHQTFNIVTPTPQAFQKSQGQIMQSASREMERQRARRGF